MHTSTEICLYIVNENELHLGRNGLKWNRRLQRVGDIDIKAPAFDIGETNQTPGPRIRMRGFHGHRPGRA